MNRYLKPLIFTLISALSVPAMARGGRGGGGGGPGGGFRPGGRPSHQPGRPGGGQGLGNRPGTLPTHPGPSRPGGGPGGPGGIGGWPGAGGGIGGPGRPDRPGGRPGAGDIGGGIGRHPAGHLPGTPGHRPGYPYYRRGELRPNVHHVFRFHPTLGYPFSRGWCGAVNWRYARWPYWAGVATGAAITSWLRWAPYGGYGSSQQIVYYPVEPAPQPVYDQAVVPVANTASQGQTQVSDDADWLNIGTFGIIAFGQTSITSTLQLAVTSDGTLRGLEWDLATNKTFELYGSIDQGSQRIAWQRAGDPEGLYFESNIDQLTQSESLVNVFNPQNKTLVSWQIIQVDASDLPPQGS